MENQENEVSATPRQMIHLKVAGEVSQEDLLTLITQFQETALQGGVIATPNNVVADVITTTSDVSGLILTPKMTAVEIAAVVVDVLQGFDIAQGNEPSPADFGEPLPTFAQFEEEAKLEIQFILRFGSLPKGTEGRDEATRDALFESVTRSLGSKLTAPSLDNLITVTRIAQKEGDEDFDVNFKDLVMGDIFKHGDHKLVAQSNPYVNWIANPLPIVTIDAKVYQEPELVNPEEAKATSKPSKKKVQSKPSNSTARNRKK
jgi:hypothetical protein